MTLQPVLIADDLSTLSLIQKQAGAKQEVALTPIALEIPLHLEDNFKLLQTQTLPEETARCIWLS